jgi:hypothetical protein
LKTSDQRRRLDGDHQSLADGELERETEVVR